MQFFHQAIPKYRSTFCLHTPGVGDRTSNVWDGNSKVFDAVFPCFLLCEHQFSPFFPEDKQLKSPPGRKKTSNNVKKDWKKLKSLLAWHGLKRFQQFLCSGKRNWKGVGIPLAEIPAHFQFQEKKTSANPSDPK